MSDCPHSKQNFAPAGSSVPQVGHLSAKRVPHSRQNLAWVDSDAGTGDSACRSVQVGRAGTCVRLGPSIPYYCVSARQNAGASTIGYRAWASDQCAPCR
jgi:hypothetical protein